ncbi:MAG: biopolymer transporter ExbD [Bacteroidia bacterium]|nr:biopolymer transporter ExbD [Bacteroidia bacterium]
MAEMMQKDSGGGKGKPKKRSTRIDMTAMVDVAFLLLTFFILTTTMATPKVMELNVPPKKDPKDVDVDVKESKVLTVIMGKNDRIYYYFGITDPEVKKTNFSDTGIRKILMDHIHKPGVPNCKGKETTGGCWDPIVVLKPTENSKYKNVVDILDEMSITQTPKYALTKLTEVDSTLIVDHGFDEFVK